MQETTLNKELYDQLADYIANVENKETALIEVLHKAQNLFGFIPKEVQLFIGEKLGVPASKVFGVVSFYSYFTTEPKGKYVINVCMGTACFVRKADSLLRELEKVLCIKPGETTENKMYSIEALRCVGACGLAPVIMVNDEVYGKVTVGDIPKILAKYAD